MSNTSHLRSALVMGASIVALTAVSAPAFAQASAPAPAAPPPAAPAVDTTGGGADVIVTAEHRQTRLQKVPVAVSVFTGAQRDRAGIASVQDVTNFTPGFTYDTVTVNAGMRGVTRQSFNVTDDSRVAAYEDEFFVYSPYNLSLSSLFFSQEQIQRGPQNVGGRNAEGGSIDMIAVRPTDHPYGEIRATAANYNAYEIEGAASDQIAPGLNARIAGRWNYQGDGYLKNVEGGPSEFGKTDDWHIEGSVDWKPSSNFDVYARAFAGAWETDEGQAGSRQAITLGSWDEVNLEDPHNSANAGEANLFFNPNYGFAAPGGNPTAPAGAAAVAGAQAAAGGFPQELPIAVSLIKPGLLNNPTTRNNWEFASARDRTAELQNYDDLNYTMTYHFPSADLKYIGGVQGYDYTLNLPDIDTNVRNYTLPGSAFGEQGAIVGALEGLGVPAIGFTGLPAPSTLTIHPDAQINFVENDWWTSHEVSLQSTDNSPFQYTIGAMYYFQQYSQPNFENIIGNTQANLFHPLGISPAFGAALGSGNAANIIPFLLPSYVLNPANNAAANPTGDFFSQTYHLQNRSVDGYAQVSYKLTDNFKITGNIRVSNDEKSGYEALRYIAFGGATLGTLYNFLVPLYGASTPAIDVTALAASLGTKGPGVKTAATINANGFATRTLDASDTEVTGGAGLEYTPTNDIFMYARYNRGYAPLSFNAGFISANPLVGPEFLNSYEVGYKQSFGRTFTIDAAAFYYDYDAIQLPISVLVNGLTEGQFINYPKAESTGVELEAVWNPTRDLLFTAVYSYDYTALLTGCSGRVVGANFVANAGSACLINTEDPLGTGPGARVVPGQPTTATALVQSVKGSPLPNAPRNKFAITGSYTWHFDPGNLTFAATFVWRDTQLGNTTFNTPYNTAPSWDDVDLRATWSGDHDRYEIIGFVKNLTNSVQYPTGAGGSGLTGNSVTASAPGTFFYNTTYNLNPPRTYGVELRYKFF